ncbi:MAG: glycosyltransferase family 1 protein [Patescibacteria group bacterium]|nr:glycosyltransferase family 1 protein [Patescibacteria group bacterium]MDD5164858.1 glycosyltransferase family 1 protein [Patescibacteria group bacterium]MDD5534463.1 glycosyltransferase family 1 protein [Patescibacteria group bacterium]
MKIAIDARPLTAGEPVGKEKFTINVLEELFRLDKSNQYILYLNQEYKKPLPTNFSPRIIKVPDIFWHFFVLIDLIFKKPNLFFAPISYIIPALNFFGKNIIVIYDLCVFLPFQTGSSFKTKFIEKMFLRFAMRNAKKIITISESTKKDIIKYFPIAPENISVIYPAVADSFRFIDDRQKRKSVLDKFSLPEKFILFVGTLEPRKNLVRLISAYHKLTDGCPLVIVGKKGWDYQEIFDKIKELNLGEKVIFLNYVSNEDLPYLYNGAVCFVYPSLYEGFGLPILEAMACGTPTVTSNISSLPEAAGEAAILVDPCNIDDITRDLSKILTDENLRQDLREKGLKQAQKFSWQKTAQEVLKALQDIK